MHELAVALRARAVDVQHIASAVDTVAARACTSEWHGRAAARAQTEAHTHAKGLRAVATALAVAADEVTRTASTLDAVAGVEPDVVAALLAPVPALLWAAHERSARADTAQAMLRRCAQALHVLAERCDVVARAARESVPRAHARQRWAAERDRANRVRLAARLGAWTRHQRLGAACSGTSPAEAAAHGVDLRVVAALRTARLDPVTGQRVPVLLLTYEPTAWSGRGRVVLAYGDPQRARDVAFLVNGLGSRADPGMTELDVEAWQVYARARLAATPQGTRATSTLVWLGYQTPDLPQVAFAERAERGARALAADIAALRRAHGEEQPHVTVIGHSYGSLVAALATHLRPGDVDDLVAVGSPGMGATAADQLGVPTGHVWAGAASVDPVTHLSRFGVDPAARSFGAHRFPAEAQPRSSLSVHSGYFAAGSSSLTAIARIVAGQTREVPYAPGRTDHGYLGAVVPFLALSPALALVLSPGLPPTFHDPAAEQAGGRD